MADTNSSDAVNPSPTQPDTETEELLLADLVGTENVDPIFEELSDRDAEIGTILKRLKNPMVSEDVTGGDLDDDWYQAEVVGEEAVGGDNPTPDQSVTENLLRSMGISSIEGHPVETWKNLQQRDLKRWELDPESSEDYPEHDE
jgi:Family of unknown function (DUF6335)